MSVDYAHDIEAENDRRRAEAAAEQRETEDRLDRQDFEQKWGQHS